MPADVARHAHAAWRRRRATDAGERPCRRAGVAEVLAHQRFDALLRLPALAAEHLGDALLQLVRQDVDVAPALEVQHRADAQEEVFGVLELAVGALELALGPAGPELPDMARRDNVAQRRRERS